MRRKNHPPVVSDDLSPSIHVPMNIIHPYPSTYIRVPWNSEESPITHLPHGKSLKNTSTLLFSFQTNLFFSFATQVNAQGRRHGVLETGGGVEVENRGGMNDPRGCRPAVGNTVLFCQATVKKAAQKLAA